MGNEKNTSEVKLSLGDCQGQSRDNDTTVSSKFEESSIELHWSFNILIYYKYFTTKYRYQILFVLSLFKFGVWLHKLYEDVGQAIEYSNDADTAYFIISVLMLILPTLMCLIYMILTKLIDIRCQPSQKDIIVALINGLLLVPWQVKQCLDTLHYSAQRICDRVWSVYDAKVVFSMGVDCDLLEFFEDMFSGFLGICLQLYIILVNWGWTGEEMQDTKLVTGELIGSILSLLSMLEAIRRRDDRFLSSLYVRLGWISMFMSRALAICLATTIIKSWIIVIIFAHAIAINSWVFYIARQSYIDVILNDLEAILDWKIAFGRGRLLLWLLSFVIYGLPSIIYWPLMFQMKDAGRTQLFLVIILIENVCFGAIWTVGVCSYQITTISFNHLVYVNLTLLIMTLFSIFWLLRYLHHKPYNVDKKVLMKILNEEGETQEEVALDYGVSYIFYSKVFALPTFNQLLTSIPPYCDEDRLLFSLIGDSEEEGKENEGFSSDSSDDQSDCDKANDIPNNSIKAEKQFEIPVINIITCPSLSSLSTISNDKLSDCGE
ncbi:uncharacterized protein LOC107362013 [Tetranychus urticae]|uniref:XK-related protein n=1 Tax=Tetranychus urticae TaxID=32264 RepID=T1KA78_TETUR|nr:uncharacterized protein LOC107362013 [Tetranychus urticae]